MIEYTIEDEFQATVEHYWDTFFSEAYNAALWPHIDVDYVRLEYRVEDEGAAIFRRQRLTPRREVPRVLERLVKGAIAYEETNRWTRATSSMSVVVTPNFLANAIDARGTYTIVPAGEGRVLRRWTGRVACKVPMLGGAVEKSVVEQVQESYRRTTAFTRDWLAAHPPGT